MTHHKHEADLINNLGAFSGSFLWAPTLSKQTRKEILLSHVLHTGLSQEEGESSDEMRLSASEILD